MSDTIDFLTNGQGAAPDVANDIDLDALAESVDTLTTDEIVSVATSLELEFTDEASALTAIKARLAEHAGTANVIDITHANAIPAAPPAAMVDGEEIDPTITESDNRTWLNPFTGNRVVNGCRDIDGRVNVDGIATRVSAPNPIDRRSAVYPSEMR